MTSSVRLIAFYLPQFHPIPENDIWWGEGFTEWTGVAAAKPLFFGHNQPQLPSNLGFYDLRVPEVRAAQARMAKAHGIHGFCYHYYWFSGRRLLERPLNEVLASGEPDLPFCICWANENWTRRWDGRDQEILVGQSYSEADDRRFILDLLPLLQDPRYIRVNDCPMIVVYRTRLLPDPQRTAEIWREEAQKAGLAGLYLVRVETFDEPGGNADPADIGFDAACEFPPHGIDMPVDAKPPIDIDADFSGRLYDYQDMARRFLARAPVAYRRFRGVMPSWDNTARVGRRAHIALNATPETYKQWLEKTVALTRIERAAPEQLIFINAWNEWGEGCHLEPDKRYGSLWLDATKSALGIETLPVADDLDPSRTFITLKEESERINDALAANRARIDKQNVLIDDLNSRISALTQEREQQGHLHDEAIAQIYSLTAQNAQLSRVVTDQESQIQNLALERAQQAELLAERAGQISLLAEREHQLSQLALERDQQLNQVGREREQQISQLIQEREQQISQLTQEWDHQTRLFAQKHEQLLQSLHAANDEALQLGQECKRLESELASSLAAANAQAKAAEDESHAVMRTHQRALIIKDEEIGNLQTRLGHVEFDLAAHQRELSNIRSSTLWRAVQPVRGLAARFPRTTIWLGNAVRRDAWFVKYPRRLLRLVWWTITGQLINRLRARRAIARSAATVPMTAEMVIDHIYQLDRFAKQTNPLHADAGQKRHLICVSHCSPVPPAAGNEFRVNRMLAWAMRAGYEITLVLAPLPGEVLAEQTLKLLQDTYASVVIVYRDGQVAFSSDRALETFQALNGQKVSQSARRWQPAGCTEKVDEITRLFAHDGLGGIVRALAHDLSPEIVLVNYVFMAPLLVELPGPAIKIIDTHDVFSTKAQKVERFGITDSFSLSAEEEASLLAPADLIIAIQSEEQRELKQLVADKPVVTVGVDIEIAADRHRADRPTILLVGSDNALNRHGLLEFLEFAWPLIKRDVPDVHFEIVGTVGQHDDIDDPQIQRLGRVDNLSAIYATAWLVINPAIAGTGLKIKTVEALGHLCPLVSWPSGVDGLDAEARALCQVADNWYSFAQAVISALNVPPSNDHQTIAQRKALVARLFGADHVYAELTQMIKELTA